jgi:hypothetical protein
VQKLLSPALLEKIISIKKEKAEKKKVEPPSSTMQFEDKKEFKLAN